MCNTKKKKKKKAFELFSFFLPLHSWIWSWADQCQPNLKVKCGSLQVHSKTAEEIKPEKKEGNGKKWAGIWFIHCVLGGREREKEREETGWTTAARRKVRELVNQKAFFFFSFPSRAVIKVSDLLVPFEFSLSRACSLSFLLSCVHT